MKSFFKRKLSRAEVTRQRDAAIANAQGANTRLSLAEEELVTVYAELAQLAEVLAFLCAKADGTITVSRAELDMLPEGARLAEDHNLETDVYVYTCARPKRAIEVVQALPEHTM